MTWQPLLNGEFSPTTDSFGFVEAHLEDAVEWFVGWQAPKPREIRGGLRDALEALLPLTDMGVTRELLVPTRGRWTAYFANFVLGSDPFGPMSYAAKSLGCRTLRVAAVLNTINGKRGRYGATVLVLYGPDEVDFDNAVRRVEMVNDSGRWMFRTNGEPFPFEETERYSERRVRDRFTPEMLERYLAALGIHAFDESFYMPDGSATLLENTKPWAATATGYSLEEVRAGW